MEPIFKVLPLAAFAGWNATMNKILNKKKIHSEAIVNAIAYYAFALSLMGFFDVEFVKDLILSKGTI